MQSPFLRLPAELRNKIYQLVFSNGVIQVLAPWENRYRSTISAYSAPALLQTCRQIHGEATPVLFSTATFETERYSLEYFIETIGAEKAALIATLPSVPHHRRRLVGLLGGGRFAPEPKR
jgi:hypothetical protein